MKIILDIETTGLVINREINNDEILHLTIINTDGDVLFNSYFQPENHMSWKDAEKYNGITPEFVLGKPKFKSCINEIQSIIDEASLLIGYSLSFELNFLRFYGINIPIYKDIFDEMSIIKEKFNKRMRLSDAAMSFDFKYDSYSNLTDAYATLHIYKCLINDAGFTYKGLNRTTAYADAKEYVKEYRFDESKAKVDKKKEVEVNRKEATIDKNVYPDLSSTYSKSVSPSNKTNDNSFGSFVLAFLIAIVILYTMIS